MLAKVLIKRQFKAGHEKEILALLNQLRAKAMVQPGYVSGITLVSPEFSHQLMVIGTWQSPESWYLWKNDPSRRQFEAMLEIYQESQTVYETYVVGTPFA